MVTIILIIREFLANRITTVNREMPSTKLITQMDQSFTSATNSSVGNISSGTASLERITEKRKVGGKELEDLVWRGLAHCRNHWLQDELWSNWATQLDRSDIWYVLPDEYDTLASLTDKRPLYMEAVCDNMEIRILGSASQEDKVAGRLWKDGMSGEGILCQWAKAVQEDRTCPEREVAWSKSFKEALDYFRKHRHLVRSAGKLLDIDMENHDLTKTTLFQYALGYLWHWPLDHSEEMKGLAWQVVKERHLCQEDHHPEFGGKVNPAKLFTDRLAVGIQKNKERDDKGGWKIDAWIPGQFREEWEGFQAKWGHINMYTILDMSHHDLPSMDKACLVFPVCKRELVLR